MNEVVQSESSNLSAGQAQPVPFTGFGGGRALASHVNAGTVAIEQERAIAEAQGKLIVAQRVPRSTQYALAELIEACRIPALAAQAFYSYPRGGEQISGPTIRLAEEIARCWGNFEYGIRELSQKEGVSEMEAFAWDLQTNVLSTQRFTVRHLRDKRGGAAVLTDQRDIYELTANMGGRRLRARILAVVPKWLVEKAVEECRRTIAGDNSIPIAERVRKMVVAFAKFDVKPSQLETRLGKKLDDAMADDIVDLQGIYMSLKEGHSTVAEWFGDAAEETKAASGEAAKTAILAQAGGDKGAAAQAGGQAKKSGGKSTEKPASGAADTKARESGAAESDQNPGEPPKDVAAEPPAQQAQLPKKEDLF